MRFMGPLALLVLYVLSWDCNVNDTRDRSQHSGQHTADGDMVFFTIYNLQDRTALISFLKTLLLENRRYRSHVLNYSLLSQLLGPCLAACRVVPLRIQDSSRRATVIGTGGETVYGFTVIPALSLARPLSRVSSCVWGTRKGGVFTLSVAR